MVDMNSLDRLKLIADEDFSMHVEHDNIRLVTGCGNDIFLQEFFHGCFSSATEKIERFAKDIVIELNKFTPTNSAFIHDLIKILERNWAAS